MGYGFKHGAGGTPLQFRVIASLTEPASFRENDIWVKAEGMTGWIVAPRLPEAEEGTVCIITGENASVCFNAVRKNALTVCPVSAWQVIEGEWKQQDAWAFVGGALVQFSSTWDGYYFKDGDQFESVTGGWAAFSEPANTTVTIGDILAVKSDNNGQTARLSTVGAVDLTEAKTLWIDSPGASSGRYAGTVHVCTEKNTGTSVASVTLGDSSAYKSGKYSIDVSGLSGSFYIFMTATAQMYGAGYADARAIWSEGGI